jgi:hypothetical protein
MTIEPPTAGRPAGGRVLFAGRGCGRAGPAEAGGAAAARNVEAWLIEAVSVIAGTRICI